MDVIKSSYCLNLLMEYYSVGPALLSWTVSPVDKFLYPNATTYHNAW